MTSPPAPVAPIPSPTPTPDPPVDPSTFDEAPQIAFLDAVAFARACKEEGTECFKFHISDSGSVSGQSTKLSDPPVDFSSIPPEYHNFTDVFSKSKADSLPPHQPYDLKINLEDRAVPPLGPIYSLSPAELAALREFIDENLKSGFIHPTSSPYRAPVLFVKKKDRKSVV